MNRPERRKQPRTTTQREAQLLTCDYGGVERKRRVLAELIAGAHAEAVAPLLQTIEKQGDKAYHEGFYTIGIRIRAATNHIRRLLGGSHATS